MAVASLLSDVWSTTGFENPELDRYAEQQIIADSRRGVQIVAVLAILAQIAVAILALINGSIESVIGTNGVVVALSLHMLVSARHVHDVRALHLLGMTFLILAAVAITFLAHRTGDLSIDVIAAMVMLFVAVPLIPWALREAAVVIALTYFLLTMSLASVPGRFDAHALMVLQLLLVGSAIVVMVITGRNTLVRKHDIRARFDLEKAHKRMELLSLKDHLTGAWNRRYLEEQFPRMLEHCRSQSKALHVAVLDIDDFKGINDRFGHHVGDEILIALAKVFMERLGNKGCLIRLGGDEFEILYSGDDLEGLIDVAVAAVQKSPVAASLAGERKVTLSAGIVTVSPGQPAQLDDLYKTADCALYAAKTDGRPTTLSDETGEQFARTGTWKI